MKDKVSQVKAVKRKKSLVSETDHSSNEDSLEQLESSTGKKTTREKLLDILGRRANPKKPRASRALSVRNPRPRHSKEDTVQIINPPSDHKIDYTRFNNNQLIEMLKDVGLDTSGFERDDLLKSCNAYTELIIAPPYPSQDEVGLNPVRSNISDSSFTFTVAPNRNMIPAGTSNRILSDNTSKSTPGGDQSTSLLPSLEHCRFLYPRPHPTILSSPSCPKPPNTKGKAKAKSPTPSNSDWNPHDEDLNDSNTENGCISDLESTPASPTNFQTQTPHNTHLPKENTQHGKKVDSLETELEALTHVVNKLVRASGDNSSPQSKRRGGRVADRVRFHIDTLIGLPEGSKLPSPDDTNNSPKDPFVADDPCFPYQNGPGHKNATPQQLQIMQKMLDTAGISSFRPDFSKNARIPMLGHFLRDIAYNPGIQRD
ncbi:uncharacterized protein MELLADRAFT_95928 [Melampsora larici-populina 98AG31]|uniref:Uncharacterized protein n=1 Tax=Melampsora larici-populina (strain 98AG31 / pathotype 3-4-7) TaxID=747676 RepID=F4RDS3_MELLP|nr:uncharacterized protein MELLADRAFT_95928 [Melampsora larici-populina 98AG31]EGG09450.1 hypothetical protein MELLADRAFT_95928 [Melampsora larici-populina 98AG31]